MTLNRDAMQLPKNALAQKLVAEIAVKKEILRLRDEQYGVERPHIWSYGENIYMPEIFGFEMKDFYTDPALALEMTLRSNLFWLQNSHDDSLPSLRIPACSSMYFDMTLFGEKIAYTSEGVPVFHPHPLAEKADLSVIRSFDFFQTGEMPWVIAQYEVMQKIASEEYGDLFTFEFPQFQRGPLDILIQLRGYENFIEDLGDNPVFIQEALEYFADERYRFRRESAAYLHIDPKELPVYINEDWINIPFISPRFFDEYIVPVYQRIQAQEGPVVSFHTCGRMEALCRSLAELFPAIETWDISGWNDLSLIDAGLPRSNSFNVNFINTFVLVSSRDEHRQKLLTVKEVAKHRSLSVCAQAIVKLLPTMDETMGRMNDFIDMARQVFAE